MRAHDERLRHDIAVRRPTEQSARRSPEAIRIGDRYRPSAGAIINLQPLAGNRAVASLLAAGKGPLEDLRRAAVQRDAEKASAQRDAEKASAGPISPVLGVVNGGGGVPLPEGIRSRMEAHLGADLGGVKVHSDAASTESVGARAYTVGEHIVVHPSQPAPGSPAGDHLFAHELTHVVQQRSGPVEGSPAAGGIRVSDPTDRFERAAEESALAVTAQRARGPASRRASAAETSLYEARPGPGAPSVQRYLIDKGAALEALHTGAENVAGNAQVPSDTYHKLTGWMGKKLHRPTKLSQAKAAKAQANRAFEDVDSLIGTLVDLDLPGQLARMQVGPPGSARKGTDPCDALFHLKMLKQLLTALRKDHGGLPGIDLCLEGVDADAFAIRSIMAGPQPGGMSWLEAIRAMGHAGAIREGVDKGKEDAQAALGSGRGQGEALGTFLRGPATGADGKPTPLSEAGQFIKSALQATAAQVVTKAKTVVARINADNPEFEFPEGWHIDDPSQPADLVRGVRRVVQNIVPLMFPGNASYIMSNPALFMVMSSAGAHIATTFRNLGPGQNVQLDKAAIDNFVCNFVFLRTISPVLGVEMMKDKKTLGGWSGYLAMKVVQNAANDNYTFKEAALQANFGVTLANIKGPRDAFFHTLEAAFRQVAGPQVAGPPPVPAAPKPARVGH